MAEPSRRSIRPIITLSLNRNGFESFNDTIQRIRDGLHHPLLSTDLNLPSDRTVVVNSIRDINQPYNSPLILADEELLSVESYNS